MTEEAPRVHSKWLIEQLENSPTPNLLQTHEAFTDNWKVYAQNAYQRLVKTGIRAMGDAGCAELAVKVTKFLIDAGVGI